MSNNGSATLDQNAMAQEIERQVQARLAATQPQQPMFPQPQPFAQPAGFGMQPAAQMGVPQCTGVMVPIELTGPDGSKVTLYLQYPASCAASPQAMAALVSGLMQQGYPVRAFAPKQQGWGGNGGGNGGYRNGGGYNGNGGGGGYRRW